VNLILLCFNAGIRRGRSSSEHLVSLGIAMKSLQYGPKTFFFFGVIDFAVVVNCLLKGSINVAFLTLLAFQHINYWKRS
jgi:hypothetical protein